MIFNCLYLVLATIYGIKQRDMMHAEDIWALSLQFSFGVYLHFYFEIPVLGLVILEDSLMSLEPILELMLIFGKANNINVFFELRIYKAFAFAAATRVFD